MTQPDTSEITLRWSLEELAVLEAARIAEIKATHKGKFDGYVFEAVARHELERLRKTLCPTIR